METLELQLKSADDVLKTVATQLGVDASDLKVTILDEQSGLFGKKKFKVQVERLGAASAEVEEVKAPKTKKAEAKTEEAPAKPAARGRKPKVEKTEEPVAETEDESGDDAEEAVAAASAPEIIATEADAEKIIAIIEEILNIAEIDAEVKVHEISGKYVNLELDGKDASHLIGKQGEVLNAFQYIVNLILTKQLNNGVRLTLDGNNYRTRREEVLTTLAQNVAAEVLKRGEEAVFDALPAFERRIVHKALSEIAGVTTYSEGEEPHRHVVIAPAS
jgi:spoIIIJ-associated protein